jgi:hypothetical protein
MVMVEVVPRAPKPPAPAPDDGAAAGNN